MSSFNNERFFNSGFICDSLSVSEKTPDFRDKLIILALGVSSTSRHDINRLVGIGSNAHVLVGDVRLNFLTSSEVAASKHVKGHFISGGGINSFLRLSVQNFNRKSKKVEKLAQRGRSVESDIYGMSFSVQRVVQDVHCPHLNTATECMQDVTPIYLKAPPKFLKSLKGSFSGSFCHTERDL